MTLLEIAFIAFVAYRIWKSYLLQYWAGVICGRFGIDLPPPKPPKCPVCRDVGHIVIGKERVYYRGIGYQVHDRTRRCDCRKVWKRLP